MPTDSTSSWLGAAVTASIAAVTAIWAFLRFIFVTRMEVNSLVRESEERFEMKIDEVKQTLIDLHEDNKDARHRLRDDINTPLVNIASTFEALRQELVRHRRDDIKDRYRNRHRRAHKPEGKSEA